MPDRYDLIVLGLGVGGVEVASQCAREGMSVLAVEQRLVGGKCPYWGCVPSKAMVRAAQVLAEAGRVDKLAGTSSAIPEWAVVAREGGQPECRRPAHWRGSRTQLGRRGPARARRP